MRFKMVGKFKTNTNFLHYKPAYNGHNALDMLLECNLKLFDLSVFACKRVYVYIFSRNKDP